jgi:hypothetical protein
MVRIRVGGFFTGVVWWCCHSGCGRLLPLLCLAVSILLPALFYPCLLAFTSFFYLIFEGGGFANELRKAACVCHNARRGCAGQNWDLALQRLVNL